MARLKPTFSPRGIDPRWLGLGLRAAWSFSEGAGSSPRDALNRLAATLAASDWGSGAQGPVIVHDATTDRTQLAAASSTLLPTADITIVLGSRKTDATNRDSGAFGVNTATAAEYCAVKLPAADGTVYWDYGGVTDGTTRLTAAGLSFGDDTWGFTVGPRGMEIWQNGGLRASNAANPTRTASSAALKLGLYDSTLEGDLAAYNCIYIFAGQLSADDIALLTSDPARLFLEPHIAARAGLVHAAIIGSASTAVAFQVIRSGRTLREEQTATAERVPIYGFMEAQHSFETYATSYGFVDAEYVFDTRTLSYGYHDGEQVFNAYVAAFGYHDAEHVHTAGKNTYGALDAEHRQDAYALSYGYHDAQQAFNAYLTAYGYTEASHSLNAYTRCYGAVDAEHVFAAYPALRGYTDATHALAIFGLPTYGYLDASHALEVRTLCRGFADAQHGCDAYALSYGAIDAQHGFAAYTRLAGYVDATHALSAYARAFGYVDGQHLLDTAAAFYGWCLNQTSGAASRYEDFDFNSLADAGGRYLAASSAGIHELGGDDDDGVAIDALVLTGDLDFGSDMQKRMTDLYLAGEASAALTVTVSADGAPVTYALPAGPLSGVRNRKINLGRGAKGRYWRVGLANVEGAAFEIDEVSMLPEILSRRR